MKNQLKYGLGVGLLALLLFFTLYPLLAGRVKNLQAQMSPKPSPSSPGMGMMGDQHFITMMIPHHEDAIAMADLALTRAEHPEIKQLAKNIKTSQSQEIEQMRVWYQKWYGTSVPKMDHKNMGGMMHGGNQGMMSSMSMDLTTLRNAKNFDQVFIKEMIPHHEMAVVMAKNLVPNSKQPEMKTLAQEIIQSQTKEINEMQSWYQQWYATKPK